MTKKILVVDDDPTTNKLVSALLKAEGYMIDSAIDGLDALAQIQKECPDLVVLDVMMPEVDGYDVCYQLRFNEQFQKTPIVLLTVREQELDDSISSRVNIEYVPKPVDSDLLLEKIRYLLNKVIEK
ncbi:hypothetical protein MNBD_UNCLBAC01-1278 [hydrothermal vent metagenome]|uniref:Response regulatory domain-containing protein n=1 Tax=hydrothermal vent metagenome TaxID=652676 RepID=A0A3B1E3H8_9ZZZZ